jgi:hypothetical protein
VSLSLYGITLKVIGDNMEKCFVFEKGKKGVTPGTGHAPFKKDYIPHVFPTFFKP